MTEQDYAARVRRVQAVLDATCRCGKVDAEEVVAALNAPAPSEPGLLVTEALMADLVRGPYLTSLMEDFHAGRTDAEHVAAWLMGDLAAPLRGGQE